jgi:hydrogenase/urease accessory protein HupE
MHSSFDLFGPFLRLGYHHILTGYDHLMFVFGMLLICQRWQTILKIVVSFSVAHSITLAVATFDWFNLPSRIDEPLISASLIVVGVENLLRRDQEPTRRWMLAFAFGLVHGFGFASGLREMGIATSGGSIGVPLFGFNLGVELGQITAGAVFLPLLWLLRKNAFFVRRIIPVLSAFVVIGGVYWTIKRLFF